MSLAVATLALFCATVHVSASALPIIVTYDVRGRADGVVEVEATTTEAARGGLAFDDGRGRNAEEGALWEAGRWRSVDVEGDLLKAEACRRGGCRVRYRYRLADLAARAQAREIASTQDGIVIAPPGTYLAVPRGGREGRFRLRMSADTGVSAVSGVFPAPDGDGRVAPLADLPMVSYSAFGAFETRRVEVGGGVVEVAFAPATLPVAGEEVARWAKNAAEDVSTYYGRLPVPRVLVIVLRGGRRGVGYGTTMGYGGAAIIISVGASARVADLEGDWVLTHEMVHLGMPNLTRADAWMEEGLATYVEPLARARRGRLSVEAVWQDLVRHGPQGVPGPGGLGANRGWEAMYWGGALFWLLADVEIRERTSNRRSVDDALRGVQAAGGSIAVRWPVERFLAAADEAVGVSVLRPLFARLGHAAGGIDLPGLWSRLGIAPSDPLRFEDDAPLASIRRALTAPPSAP